MKIRDIRNVSKEDLFDALGLQMKGSTSGRLAGMLGELALGALAGAAVALLLAPKSGRETRRVLMEHLRSYGQRMRHSAADAPLPH